MNDLLKALAETEKRLDMECAYFSINIYSDGSGEVIGGRNIDDVYCVWNNIDEAVEKIKSITIEST
jgi:hypothetical protein